MSHSSVRNVSNVRAIYYSKQQYVRTQYVSISLFLETANKLKYGPNNKANVKLTIATALQRGMSERARKMTGITGIFDVRRLSAREKRRKLTKVVEVPNNSIVYISTQLDKDNVASLKNYTSSNIFQKAMVQSIKSDRLQKNYVRNYVKKTASNNYLRQGTASYSNRRHRKAIRKKRDKA